MSTVDYTVVHAVPGHVEKILYGRGKPSLLLSYTAFSIMRCELDLTTLREFYMLRFMNTITDKEDWHTVKVLDDTIAQRWKEEAIAEAREAYRQRRDKIESERGDSTELDQYPFFTVPRDESDMTVRMADYCIAELQYRAREFSQSATGAIIVYNGDVVKSDTAVSPETKATLLEAVRVLENIPAKDKYWRPGSNNQVLDLVHPSLFPVVFGKTKVLSVGEKVLTLEDCIQRIGQGEVIPVPKELGEKHYSNPHNMFNPYSNKFQCLPCEVDIAEEKAKIISYINNLHPKHRALYSVIEDVITAAISLWDITLAPLGKYAYRRQRIQFEGVEYDPDTREWEEEGGPEGDEDSDEFYELKRAWVERTKRVILPEPEVPFSPEHLSSPPDFSLKDMVAPTKRPLQVIVKLSNIELTPDNPDYPGGTWQADGNPNEHIVATAIYCYSSSNITAPSLAFRQMSNDTTAIELPYTHEGYGWLSSVFGCEHEGPTVQVAGSVEMREGRLLTFPNVLQHQAHSFSLADRTKPGHCKVLALSLVDPNVRILSSAMVPPQQLNWWREDLEESKHASAMPSDSSEQGRPNLPTLISRLSTELKDNIYSRVDGYPISLVEAKQMQEEFVEERKKFVIGQGKSFESELFYLAED